MYKFIHFLHLKDRENETLNLGSLTPASVCLISISHTCVLSHFSSVWRFATHQAPLSMGFSRQQYWSGLPYPPPGDLPNPGIEGFPGGSEVKASACNVGDLGLIPGWGRSLREGNGNPLQYSCLENPMDGGAWWATVHGVTKSRTRLSDFTITYHYQPRDRTAAPATPALQVNYLQWATWEAPIISHYLSSSWLWMSWGNTSWCPSRRVDTVFQGKSGTCHFSQAKWVTIMYTKGWEPPLIPVLKYVT